MRIDWLFALVVAIGTIGLLEWAKRPFEEKNVPWWVWWAAAPLTAVILAIAITYLPGWIVGAVLGLCLAVLCYDNLIKFIQGKIDKL